MATCGSCSGAGGSNKYVEGADGIYRWVWVPCRPCGGSGKR